MQKPKHSPSTSFMVCGSILNNSSVLLRNYCSHHLFVCLEVDNIVTGLDLAMAQMSLVNGEAHENSHVHIECVKRRLVDLYTICKPQDSEIVAFVRERLAKVSLMCKIYTHDLCSSFSSSSSFDLLSTVVL